MHLAIAFTVTSWEEQPTATLDTGASLALAHVVMSCTGDFVGSCHGEYLMLHRSRGPSTFHHIFHLLGSAGEHSGSLVLEGTGTFEMGVAAGELTIALGMSSGDFASVTGGGQFRAGPEPPFVMTLDLQFP